MNNFKTYILSGAALLLAACSAETPFSAEVNPGEGKVLTTALAISLDKQAHEVRSAGVDINEFTVAFVRDGKTEYLKKYGEMPEIVTLPEGDYSVTASFGDDPIQGWNMPYYFGESKTFKVVANKINDDIDPVVCKLANVQVTVTFDEDLKKEMDANAKVNVKVGTSGSLNFTADNEKSGFFKFVENSTTLVAVFSGKVEGEETGVTQTFNDVKPGNHYRISFSLGKTNEPEPGLPPSLGEEGNEIGINSKLELVVEGDENGIDIPWNDIFVDDTERPNTGDPEDPEDPEDPGKDPGNDDPIVTGNPPTIVGENGILVDGTHNVNKTECVLTITSESAKGFTEFTATIISEKLTADDLEPLGLAQELNLCENLTNSQGKNIWEGLSDLGLPYDVKGKTKVEFNLNDFIDLLKVLGNDIPHTFRIRVVDEFGPTECDLVLEFKATQSN